MINAVPLQRVMDASNFISGYMVVILPPTSTEQ